MGHAMYPQHAWKEKWPIINTNGLSGNAMKILAGNDSCKCRSVRLFFLCSVPSGHRVTVVCCLSSPVSHHHRECTSAALVAFLLQHWQLWSFAVELRGPIE